MELLLFTTSLPDFVVLEERTPLMLPKLCNGGVANAVPRCASEATAGSTRSDKDLETTATSNESIQEAAKSDTTRGLIMDRSIKNHEI